MLSKQKLDNNEEAMKMSCGLPEYQELKTNIKFRPLMNMTGDKTKKFYNDFEANFKEIKDAIDFAIWVYTHCDGPIWYRAKISSIAHRIAFWSKIEGAISWLSSIASEEDVIFADTLLSEAQEYLWGGISAYLNEPFHSSRSTSEWTGYMIQSEILECYRRGENPLSKIWIIYRDPNKSASIENDLQDLIGLFSENGINVKNLNPSSHIKLDVIPVTKINVAILHSLLRALPDEYVNDYHQWFKVGAALHDFDSGEIGLVLFKQFSERNLDKALKTDFEAFWANLGRGYSGKKITLGSLVYWAQTNGWRFPRPWDRRAAA